MGYVVAGSGAATVSFAAAGDTNLNGQVDVFDLVSINSGGKYGAGTAAVWSQGDFNYDGTTSVFDLVAVTGAGVYGTGSYLPVSATGSVTAVPEPTVWWPVAVGLAICSRRLRRWRVAWSQFSDRAKTA